MAGPGKKYAVKEVFRTLQGEGFNAGTPSVFVRFSGCNLWTGRDDDRDRDSERNDVRCPLWCDTDFADGSTMSADELIDLVCEYGEDYPLVVFTGGEPMLQLSEHLLSRLKKRMAAVLAVETNGTVAPKEGVRELLDWVCVSPKVPAERLVLREGNELKVVYPDYNPSNYEEVGAGFDHWFVSPQARVVPRAVGLSVLSEDYTQDAVNFCLDFPRWRLSVQAHKMIGVP